MTFNVVLDAKQGNRLTLFNEDVLSVIDNKVLLKAINSESLPPDIKLSVDRTNLRHQSMRTVEEIIGFLNNAMRGERGITVQNALYKEGLLAFYNIKDEVNMIYQEGI